MNPPLPSPEKADSSGAPTDRQPLASEAPFPPESSPEAAAPTEAGDARPHSATESVPPAGGEDLVPDRRTTLRIDPDTDQPKSDRRIAPRRRRMLQVLLMDANEAGTPMPGWVMDYSQGGLCLSMDQPIEEGTLLKVRRPNAPASTPWVDVQVRGLRLKDGSWEIGCQFTRSVPYNVLLQFS